MDFLIKADKVVVETKRSRKGLTAKELGDREGADHGELIAELLIEGLEPIVDSFHLTSN